MQTKFQCQVCACEHIIPQIGERRSLCNTIAMKSMWREDIPMSGNPLHFFIFASKPYRKFAIGAICAVTIASTLFTSVSYVFKFITNAVARLSVGGSYDPILWGAVAY